MISRCAGRAEDGYFAASAIGLEYFERIAKLSQSAAQNLKIAARRAVVLKAIDRSTQHVEKVL